MMPPELVLLDEPGAIPVPGAARLVFGSTRDGPRRRYWSNLYLFNRRKIEMEEIDRTKEKVLMILRDNSLFPRVIRNINPIKGAVIVYSMWEGYLTDKFPGILPR